MTTTSWSYAAVTLTPSLRSDAVRYHDVYGVFGISVFAARGITVEELAQQLPLVRPRLRCAAAHRCEHVRWDNPYHDPWRKRPGARMAIDIVADLNAQDDDGLRWSTLGDAREPDRVRAGVMLLAGNLYGRAVVRAVEVDDDGQVHFRDPPWFGREEPSCPRPDRRVTRPTTPS